MLRSPASPTEYAEGNDEVAGRGPCPKCDTEMGNVTYRDGHANCFSCGHFTPPPSEGGLRQEGLKVKPSSTPSSLIDLSRADYREMRKRRITSETMRSYGYFWAGDNQVAGYYSQDGDLFAQKVRTPEKGFSVLKGPGYTSLGAARLFGWHLFRDKYDRRVVVTEGEIDAMAVGQATKLSFPAVSVASGAQGAAKSLKANYLWLDRFAEIVLWFDDDEPGREAMQECAALFKVGKVRLVQTPHGAKDAGELLERGLPGDIKDAIFGAALWRPKGIVNAKDARAHILAPNGKPIAFSYPPSMPKLQEMTGGMRSGQVIYHVAGTGIGKTAAFREIAYHLTEQGQKIGMLSFEEDLREVQFGLMSVHASERLHLIPEPDRASDPGAADIYDSKMMAIHAKVFGAGRVELFDPENAEWNLDAILGYIRYLAKALECWGIFVDPLSFVAAGIDINADERRVLDRVAAELAKLAKELGIHLEVSHHLRRTSGIPHEEGAPTSLNEVRSSGGIANFATGVVGWERNNQAGGEDWRIMQSRIIKPIRRTGKSGIADVLYYGENGRLVESQRPFPPIGKLSDAGGDQPEPRYRRGGAFPPTSTDDY